MNVKINPVIAASAGILGIGALGFGVWKYYKKAKRLKELEPETKEEEKDNDENN